MNYVRSVWPPKTASGIDEAPSVSLLYELCSLSWVCPSLFFSTFASLLIWDAARAALANTCVLPALPHRLAMAACRTSSASPSSVTSLGGSSSSSGKDAQALSRVSTSSSGTIPSMLATNEKEAVLEARLHVSSRKGQDSSSGNNNQVEIFRVFYAYCAGFP